MVSPPDFEEFYATHFRKLVLQVNAYFDDLEQAQDVVQEAFCRALDQWKKISAYQDRAAWIRRVAWNLAISQYRNKKVARKYLAKQREESASGPGPERVALVAALSEIPEKQRRAVILHYIGDLSISQIAEQENVPEGTVKSWLARGRSALFTQLASRGK
jgi:RNA polymerase sigma-70 factor (ECF subfamily)